MNHRCRIFDDAQLAAMLELVSTAPLVATALPDEIAAAAKARLVAAAVSDVTVLTDPSLQSGSGAQPAAA
jgi:hypothetical protein